jgi:hypothetical protein
MTFFIYLDHNRAKGDFLFSVTACHWFDGCQFDSAVEMQESTPPEK